MSSTFNYSQAQVIAKRNGITLSEACSLIARRVQRRKARQKNAKPVVYWWQRDDL